MFDCNSTWGSPRGCSRAGAVLWVFVELKPRGQLLIHPNHTLLCTSMGQLLDSGCLQGDCVIPTRGLGAESRGKSDSL